nr:hypothetical protein BaRGS_017163 [Batillaria attramentaria]
MTEFLQQEYKASLEETATFQAIFVYDGTTSYALMYYKTGTLKWVYRKSSTLTIGVSKGKREDVKKSFYSNTVEGFTELDRIKGNTAMIIYAARSNDEYIDYSLQFQENADFLIEEEEFTLKRENSSLIVDFAVSGAVRDDESVFRYDSRKGPADFRHANFTPIFVDEFSDDEQNTGPELNATDIVTVNVSETVRINLLGTDEDADDTVVYYPAEDASGSFQLDNLTGIVSYTATMNSQNDKLG